MKKKRVAGIQKGHIMLYALSTCVWCKKTKRLLEELGVEYHYIDVDLLSDAEKDEVVEEISRWNPSSSFPTLVIDGKKCIIGYRSDEIREALK